MPSAEFLEKAEALFRKQQRNGKFPGGQIVVRARGEEVLNVSIGLARGFRDNESEKVAVTEDTPFQVMSASKAVVAFSIAVLEDRSLVDVERPVAFYIPEFAREGKEEVTVLDVLTHRSGVLVPQLWRDIEIWADWERVQETIWNAKPLYKRGTAAYHAYEFGWILGELVQRVTGKPLPDFLVEILPKELWPLRLQIAPEETKKVAWCYWLGGKRFLIGGVNVADGFEVSNNSPGTLTSLVPGASMITTASTLAKFYEMILAGGTAADGTRLIRAETLERYIRPNVSGYDRSLRGYMKLGRGYNIGWKWPHPYSWWNSGSCVGHGGGFCVIAFGDRRTGAAVAIVTNGNRDLVDVLLRFAPLGSLIRKAFRS